MLIAVPCTANGGGVTKALAGSGCFNDLATRLVQNRPEIAIICCCTLASFRAAQCPFCFKCSCRLPADLCCEGGLVKLARVRFRNARCAFRWAADDGADVDEIVPRGHNECARCNVSSSLLKFACLGSDFVLRWVYPAAGGT